MAFAREYYYPSSDGHNNIHALQWEPENREITGILQIVHGMIEHIERYDKFARFIADRGFVVVANDHLGHGRSVRSAADRGHFGDRNGFEYLVEDVHLLRKLVQDEYPGIPYHIMGHSMGSFVTRIYLSKYGNGVRSAVIMGTAVMPAPILTVGTTITSSLIRKHGRRYRSDRVNDMTMGSYNKRFKNENSENAWLSRDHFEVALYDKDPLHRFIFTVGAFDDMFKALKYLNDDNNVKKIPRALPILLIAGEDDPVGNFGKSIKKLYKTYKRCGINNVRIKLYPGARHELLHETIKPEVFADLYRWLRVAQKDALYSSIVQ